MRDFQDAIAAMCERSIDEALGKLAEPQCERTIESRRIVGLLVETIAGYAAGSTTRELARAVHAWFGADSAALVHAAAPRPRTRRATTRDDLDVDDELGAGRAACSTLAELLRVRLAETVHELGGDHRRGRRTVTRRSRPRRPRRCSASSRVPRGTTIGSRRRS